MRSDQIRRAAPLLVIAGFALAQPARAVPLSFFFPDPIGDHIGTVDLVGMKVHFDNSTGDFTIVATSDAENPFVGIVRLNMNLINGDVAPFTMDPATFFNNALDFGLTSATTSIVVTGTDANLLEWNQGDRVATSGIPFGVPIDAPFTGFGSDVRAPTLGSSSDRWSAAAVAVVIPEPSTTLLVASGLGALALGCRRSH
jgi:hypothetical protein